MPREGTKTFAVLLLLLLLNFEIRYAPGGDENTLSIPIRGIPAIEIRYAPGGDENTNTRTC